MSRKWKRGSILVAGLAAASLLGVSAYGGRDEADQLASAVDLASGTDPAVTRALQDEILVDPELSNQSNANAVRTPGAPAQVSYPAESGATSAQYAALGAGAASCADKLDRSARWAQRLPAALAVLPGSKVTNAAGSDTGRCAMRVVTFLTSAAPRAVLGHYRSRAAAAGYAADYQLRDGDHILTGAGAPGGGAYFLIVPPQRGGGSEVAIIAHSAA